jgi:hypothetical protein
MRDPRTNNEGSTGKLYRSILIKELVTPLTVTVIRLPVGLLILI